MSGYDPNYLPTKTYVLVGQKAIILDRKNRILVLQRSEKTPMASKWSLPGGGLDDKEDPYAGIEREIEEETKISVFDLKPYYLRSYTTKENDFVLIVGYQCRAKKDTVILNWEHNNYKCLGKKKHCSLI